MRATGPVLVALVLGLTACAGPGDEPDEPRETAAPLAAPADECEFVPAQTLAQIDEGAEPGTGMTLTGTASAVLSPDYERVYFVAAKFVVTGVAQEQIGVWATNSIDADVLGNVLAVDGFAQEFTTWPDADTSGAQIPSTDPSVDAAVACLTYGGSPAQ